ncbi:hypothetical protein BH10ACT9_BH10ACT9_40810 [soil metagenome]
MARRNRRNATVLLMGAALSAAPLGLATIVSPAISYAECAPVEGAPPAERPAECNQAADEPKNEWGFNPNLTPAENLANMQLPQLSEPLVQTSLVDDVPINPTLGLPGIGVGVNLWPDLTPLVTGGAGAALGSALPAPDLSGVGAALSQLPPPQLPDLTKIPPPQMPPRVIPLICGPQITPFFTPCI